MTLTDAARILAWISLVAVLMATVVPTRFRLRAALPLAIDSGTAFATIAGLFLFAYSDDRRVVAIFCVLAAAGSELLKAFAGTRDPNINAALAKVLGALVGTCFAALALQIAAHI